MDTITIKDLGVLCHIGVPDEERAKPQRLLISVELHGDFSAACRTDDINATINYYDVSRRVLEICEKKSFKLLERFGDEIVTSILREFKPAKIGVEIKKFIISEARFVSFRMER